VSTRVVFDLTCRQKSMTNMIRFPLACNLNKAGIPTLSLRQQERHDMSVGVVHMTTAASSAGYSGMIEKNLDRVKAPGTQLEHR